MKWGQCPHFTVAYKICIFLNFHIYSINMTIDESLFVIVYQTRGGQQFSVKAEAHTEFINILMVNC